MKLISKRYGAILILLSALICSLCLFFGGVWFKASAEEEIMPTTGIFTPSDVQLSPSQIPEDASSLEAGVKLTANKKYSSISLKNKLVGEFSYTLEPIKEQGIFNHKSFDAIFTDDAGKSFTLRLSYGENNYASVIFNGIQAGINYPISSVRYENTAYMNANGVYTPIDNGEVSVVFNPDQMTIAVGADGKENVVWDFSESINDGREVASTIDVFSRYSVTFSFTDFSGDKCAMLFRKMNGASLGGIVLENTGVPAISADFTKHAIVNNTYNLPASQASDIWDGELNTNVEVRDEIGNLVAKDTKSFIPLSEGVYTIKYTTENKRGVKGERVYEINAYNPENIPEYTFSLDENSFENAQWFNGQSIYVPVMTLYDGIFLRGSSIADVNVKCNGVLIGAYKKVPGGFNFKFNQKGVYEFCYDLAGNGTKTFTVDVLERTHYLKSDLREVYILNENVDLRTAKLTIGENIEVDAEITVQYPSGTIYKNNFFQCSELGQYTVTAKATYNGAQYVAEEIFMTNETVSSLFETESGVISSFGNSSFTGREAVLLNYNGGKLNANYKNAIDISKYVNQTKINDDGTYSATDNAIPLITISIDPEAYGVPAAEDYYVNLTDAEDPTNVMSIVMHRTDSAAWTYIRAKAGEQDYVGFNNSATGKVFWNGQRGNFYTAGRYGYGQKSSFTGNTSYFRAEDQVVTLYYDNDKKQLLTRSYNTFNNDIICDFDDPTCCNGTPWKGFSSDKVYVSVQSGSVKVANATICVYGIDGINFDSELVVYDQNPTLTVKSINIKSIEGSSLKVPKAEAFDKYGNKLEVIAKAYEVDGDNLYDVKIKDGKFITAKEGIGAYKIVYTAIDKYGNRTDVERLVTVYSDDYLDVSIVYNGTISEDYTSGVTGAEIPVYNDVEINNTIGDYTVFVAVTGPDSLEVKNGKILPTKAGVYTVTHKVIDELDRSSNNISYTVTVENAQNPMVSSSVPTYFGFVRGNTYQLLDVYAVDYSVSEEAVKADIYVDGELNTTGFLLKEKVIEQKGATETNETVVIEYKLNGELVYFEGQPLRYEVPLKTIYKKQDVKIGANFRERDTYLLSRYFTLNNAEIIDLNTNNLVLKPNSSAVDGVGSATFLSPLISNNLAFKFDIADVKNSDLSAVENTTSTVKFTIINQTDITKRVEVKFVYDADAEITKLYLNGLEMNGASVLNGLLTGSFASQVEIKYNASRNTLTETNSKIEISEITTYSDGTAFEGFSKYVYLMIEVTSATDKQSNGIYICEINGQPFPGGILYNDTYAPSLALNGSCSGAYAVGESVTIPSASAYDVLSDVDATSVTVTVTNNGTPVTDVNGKTLNNVSANQEYVLTLNQSGNYVVTYNAKDAREGVMPKKEYLIIARIDTAPVISEVEIAKTVKKGGEIKVPIPEVTFAEDSEKNTFYMVYVKPNNEYQWFVEGDVITAETTGTYRILFMAIDAFGNSAYAEYEVVCY